MAQHDTPAAAAFVFRTVGDLNEHVDVYSYWTFSDVFEAGKGQSEAEAAAPAAGSAAKADGGSGSIG